MRPRIPTLVPCAEPPARNRRRRRSRLRRRSRSRLRNRPRSMPCWTNGNRRNHDIKTFDCRFKRWMYDMVFGPPDIGPSEVHRSGRDPVRLAGPRAVPPREGSRKKTARKCRSRTRGPSIGCATASRFGNTSPAKKQVIEQKLPPEIAGQGDRQQPAAVPLRRGAQKTQATILHPPGDARARAEGQIWLRPIRATSKTPPISITRSSSSPPRGCRPSPCGSSAERERTTRCTSSTTSW